MIDGSVRRRLIGGGIAAIVFALVMVGLGLTFLFERHLERSALEDLEIHVRQIVSGLDLDAQGQLVVSRTPSDPRFLEPLSGLYWQVDDDRGRQHRSRSLWDTSLPRDTGRRSEGSTHHFVASVPAGTQVLVSERHVRLDFADAPHKTRVAVAMSLRRSQKATAAFARELSIALGVLAAVLAVATVVQVQMGLQPLVELRERVARVRSGAEPRLDAPVPVEVRPLVEELNALIVKHEAEVMRSQRRAADLAHGLKTPLAALAGDVERLRALGHSALADDIQSVGDAMNRHVTRELARARSRGKSQVTTRPHCELLPLIQLLEATLSRTPAGEPIHYETLVPPGFSVPFDRTDLAEVLGNLLENATRHATSRVRVSVEAASARPIIEIDDDGEGMPAERRAIVMDRGGRLDTRGHGAGIGLAIVQDVLEAYGWTMHLGDSQLGGLRVRLEPALSSAATTANDSPTGSEPSPSA